MCDDIESDSELCIYSSLSAGKIRAFHQSLQRLETKLKMASIRWHWLDWMRIIAVHQVILYHSIEGLLIYRSRDIIGNDYLTTMRTYMNCVGMPLFFCISGMVKGLQSQKYNSNNKTITKRIYHLLSSLLVSTFLFFIPSIYINLLVQNGQYSNCPNLDIDDRIPSFIQFELYHFWKYCFMHTGFGWLWFFIILCLIEIVSIPLIHTIHSLQQRANYPFKRRNILFLFSLAIASISYFGLLRKSTSQFSFIIIGIISYCILLFAIRSFYHQQQSNRQWILILILGTIPIAMILMISVVNIRVHYDDALKLKYHNFINKEANL